MVLLISKGIAIIAASIVILGAIPASMILIDIIQPPAHRRVVENQNSPVMVPSPEQKPAEVPKMAEQILPPSLPPKFNLNQNKNKKQLLTLKMFR